MTLHLIKLCVGCDSVEDLAEWIAERQKARRRRGGRAEHVHVTRMVPRRVDELTDGGSLYWVIKGTVQARQRLLDIRPFVDDEGIGRCRLVLEPRLVLTEWQPRRPFQGWRYLASGGCAARPQAGEGRRPAGGAQRRTRCARPALGPAALAFDSILRRIAKSALTLRRDSSWFRRRKGVSWR